jgi:hypothetical protein
MIMKTQKLEIKFVNVTDVSEDAHQVILNGVDITRSLKELVIEKGIGGLALARLEIWVTVNA